MNSARATGIVLRLRPLTETSLIAHWVTSEHGRIATVAPGARRPKSAFRGRLDLFYTADFTFQRSRRSSLHTLRELSLRDTHRALRDDYLRLQQATYGVLLLELASEEETPLPELYALFADFLQALGTANAAPGLILAYELKVLAECGLQPNPASAGLTPSAKVALETLLTADLAAAARLPLAPSLFTSLRQFLHGFLIYHLGRLPAGRAAALQSGA